MISTHNDIKILYLFNNNLIKYIFVLSKLVIPSSFRSYDFLLSIVVKNLQFRKDGFFYITSSVLTINVEACFNYQLISYITDKITQKSDSDLHINN